MLKNLESVLLAICRAVIVSAFWVASRIFHKVEVHGVEQTAIQVPPRKVGYDHSPLIYAWNELQDILSV